MNDEDQQALNGVLYAHDLLLNALMKDLIDRNADSGKDTEHLDALVHDLWLSYEGNRARMTAIAAQAAESRILDLLGASCHKYWKKK